MWNLRFWRHLFQSYRNLYISDRIIKIYVLFHFLTQAFIWTKFTSLLIHINICWQSCTHMAHKKDIYHRIQRYCVKHSQYSSKSVCINIKLVFFFFNNIQLYFIINLGIFTAFFKYNLLFVFLRKNFLHECIIVL